MDTNDERILKILDEIRKNTASNSKDTSSSYRDTYVDSYDMSWDEKLTRYINYGGKNPNFFQRRKLNRIDLAEAERDIEEAKQKIKELRDKLKNATPEEREKYQKEIERQSQKELNSSEKRDRLLDEAKTLKYAKGIQSINKSLEEMFRAIQKLSSPWAEIDRAAANYARSIGMSKQGLEDLRRTTLGNVRTNQIAARYNVDTKELLKLQQDYVKGTGRAVRISGGEQEDLAASHLIMQGRENEMFLQYEKLGQNISTTANHIHRMFQEASKEGISFEKYSDNVAKNIRLAQNYTFKNGIAGLENMAKKATAIRLDMQQVANFADKVSTIEGAVTTAAKLQVLGGPFAQFSDPLGMLAEGLTDMESLQDRMVNMFGSLGKMDRTTGEITMSAFSKRQVREAAAAMGIDASAIIDSIFAETRRKEIGAQISANANASSLPPEMQELIKNSGTFQNGRAGVSINGKFKSLDELTTKDYDTLKVQSNDDSDNIRDLAINVRSLAEGREGFAKQVTDIQASIYSTVGRIEKWLLSAGGLISIATWGKAGLNTIGDIIDIVDLFRGKINTGGMTFGSLTKSMSTRGGVMGKIGKGLRNMKAASLRRMRGRVSGAGNSISNIGSQAGRSAVAGTANRAAGQTGGNFLTKLKAIGKAGPKAGVGLVAGLAGAGMNIAADNLVASGKMKKGGGGEHAMKTAGGALEGFGLGATLAPIAMALGASGPVGWGIALGAAGIGAYINHRKVLKNRRQTMVDNELKSKGLELQGEYSAYRLRQIDKALATGKMTNSLRKQLAFKGDTAVIDEINKVKAANEEKNENARILKLETMKAEIGTANISVGTANFGHETNGNRVNGKYSLGKERTVLKRGAEKIHGITETGKGSTWEEIKAKQVADFPTIGNPDGGRRSFDININGSLKLTGDNGHSVDIITELRKNPQLLRSLADMISKEISYINKGTNVVQKF